MSTNDQTCCPRFDPTPWDGQTLTWQNKRFVQDHVTSFFHIPLNYGVVMTRLDNAIRAAGTFMSKVFEGPYSQVGHWAEEMKAWLQREGKGFSKLYFYYTTCPKCAKKYGKNYVVLLAKTG